MSMSGGRQVCRYTTLRYRAGARAYNVRQCWCRVWSSLQRLSPGTCKRRPRHVQVPTPRSARRRPGGTSYPVSARRHRGTNCTLYQPGCHEPSCLTSMSYSPQSLPPLELLTESTVCLEHAMNSSVSISKRWIQTKNRLFNRLYSWGFGMLHGGPDHQGVTVVQRTMVGWAILGRISVKHLIMLRKIKFYRHLFFGTWLIFCVMCFMCFYYRTLIMILSIRLYFGLLQLLLIMFELYLKRVNL